MSFFTAVKNRCMLHGRVFVMGNRLAVKRWQLENPVSNLSTRVRNHFAASSLGQQTCILIADIWHFKCMLIQILVYILLKGRYGMEFEYPSIISEYKYIKFC